MINNEWKSSIQAAAAMSPNMFTFSVESVEADDAFSAIISYDGNFPQPWSRVDVPRGIVSIKYIDLPDQDSPIPIALSDEGDVYTIIPGAINWSKIPGTGLLSDDADGWGFTYTLLTNGDAQFVLGKSRQLYFRNALGDWETLSLNLSMPSGYGPEDFSAGVTLPDGGILIEAKQSPNPSGNHVLSDPEKLSNMSEAEILRLLDNDLEAARDHRYSHPPVSRLYRYKNREFTRIHIPESVVIHDIFRDPLGRIWLLGADGLIMRGNPEDGFEQLSFHGDREALHSGVWFKDQLIVAWGYGLFRFDGHRLLPIKVKLNYPFLNQNTPTPHSLFAFDDVVLYFDYKHGVCRWDGESWNWFDIPPGLLDREFTGLR